MREHALSCIHEIALVSELAPSTSGARANAFPRAAAPAASSSEVVVPLFERPSPTLQSRAMDCVEAVCDRMKPVGEGTGDDTALDRAFNVATSVSYGLCGLYALKHQRSREV